MCFPCRSRFGWQSNLIAEGLLPYYGKAGIDIFYFYVWLVILLRWFLPLTEERFKTVEVKNMKNFFYGVSTPMTKRCGMRVERKEQTSSEPTHEDDPRFYGPITTS